MCAPLRIDLYSWLTGSVSRIPRQDSLSRTRSSFLIDRICLTHSTSRFLVKDPIFIPDWHDLSHAFHVKIPCQGPVPRGIRVLSDSHSGLSDLAASVTVNGSVTPFLASSSYFTEAFQAISSPYFTEVFKAKLFLHLISARLSKPFLHLISPRFSKPSYFFTLFQRGFPSHFFTLFHRGFQSHFFTLFHRGFLSQAIFLPYFTAVFQAHSGHFQRQGTIYLYTDKKFQNGSVFFGFWKTRRNFTQQVQQRSKLSAQQINPEIVIMKSKGCSKLADSLHANYNFVHDDFLVFSTSSSSSSSSYVPSPLPPPPPPSPPPPSRLLLVCVGFLSFSIVVGEGKGGCFVCNLVPH